MNLFVDVALIFALASALGCKVGVGSAGGTCGSPSVNCPVGAGEKPSVQILGNWKSLRSVATGPMTFYKTLVVDSGQLHITQVCQRNDGLSVSASIVVQSKLSESEILVPFGGEHREDRFGISCLARLDRGRWTYKVSSGGRVLEINDPSSSELSQFQRAAALDY